MATIVEQELEEVLADLPEPAEDDVLAGEFINDEDPMSIGMWTINGAC